MLRTPGLARERNATVLLSGLLSIVCVLGACGSFAPSGPPRIEFTQVPEAGPGGAEKMEEIAGRAIGAKAGQQIVLFAKSGTWWVQPFASKPFTSIEQDSTWKGSTHVGTEYAALLVEPGYAPPSVADVLPQPSGAVIAVASVEGKASSVSETFAPEGIHFSGYDWDVYQVPSDSFGVMHANSPANVWTDEKGFLHLRLTKDSGEWTGAEINLARSLGYGSYSFTVREAQLEQATVLGLFTWDPLDAGQNHRELSIQLSQWGEEAIKNAQFVIQPYYIPANLHRFTSPSAAVTHLFHWEPGRVTFRTTDEPGARPRVVAEHVFSSGVPTPGGERVHINLYEFGRSRTPQQNGVEVVIEKFAYLP
jgi:hypothetical protein